MSGPLCLGATAALFHAAAAWNHSPAGAARGIPNERGIDSCP